MGCTATKFDRNTNVIITDNQPINSGDPNFESKNEKDIAKRIRVVDLDFGVRTS